MLNKIFDFFKERQQAAETKVEIKDMRKVLVDSLEKASNTAKGAREKVEELECVLKKMVKESGKKNNGN